jgi:hypothetical protein
MHYLGEVMHGSGDRAWCAILDLRQILLEFLGNGEENASVAVEAVAGAEHGPVVEHDRQFRDRHGDR